MEGRGHRDVPARPLISVVMPVYNAEPYLADAVGSIQAQTYRDWELIVVDDGSRDNSAGLAERIAARDQRIRVVRVEHRGRGAASNVGIDLARGEMTARMDADDVSLPERFAVQLDWMRRTGVEMCGANVMRFGDTRRLLWFPETHESIGRELLFRVALLLPTVLTHTEILRTHRYDESTAVEGYELFTRLISVCRMGNVPAVLLKHRCHPSQAHIVEATRFIRDMRGFRGPLFRTLFPAASRADADAIDRVADGRPFEDLAELNRAGVWLARLAQSPDPLLRWRMLLRWHQSCRRSAHLGPDAYRAHHRLAREFEVGPSPARASLRAACAMRLRWDSRLDRCARRLLYQSRRLQHAAP